MPVRLCLANDREAHPFVKPERRVDLHHPKPHRLPCPERFVPETTEEVCANATALVLGQEVEAINTDVIGVRSTPYPPHVDPAGYHNLRTGRLPLPVVERALEHLIPPAIQLFDVLAQGDLLHLIGKVTICRGSWPQ